MKVVSVTVEGAGASENITEITVSMATSDAPSVGVLLLISGGVVSEASTVAKDQLRLSDNAFPARSVIAVVTVAV